MRYLCLGYFDVEKMNARSPGEMDALMGECMPHLKELYASGSVRFDIGLATETKSLRRVNGKVRVTDGPFAETKEMIGGVFLVEAHDMEDAIRIASLHPTTRVAEGEDLGWRLEIRPIHYFEADGPKA